MGRKTYSGFNYLLIWIFFFLSYFAHFFSIFFVFSTLIQSGKKSFSFFSRILFRVTTEKCLAIFFPALRKFTNLLYAISRISVSVDY